LVYWHVPCCFFQQAKKQLGLDKTMIIVSITLNTSWKKLMQIINDNATSIEKKWCCIHRFCRNHPEQGENAILPSSHNLKVSVIAENQVRLL